MKARYIIIPIVVLAAISLTTWFLVRNFNAKPKYDLYTVRRGAVTKTVAVAGSVVSGQKFELGFLTPGIVQDVKVKTGDRVQAGDLLVIQDTIILEAQAAQARASVAAASALLNKTRNHLRPADMAVLERGLDSARVALATAQSNLQVVYRSQDTDRQSAEAALRGAETAYQNALNTYNASMAAIDQGTVAAQMALSNASNALSNAQNYYNQVLHRYNLGQATAVELQQAGAALSAANSAYLSARTAYDTAVSQANLQKTTAASGLSAADSQLQNARIAYNAAGNGSDLKITAAQNALSVAQAAYNLAEAQYQQSLAPALGADISSSSAQVAAAAASLKVVQTQIAKASIKAPVGGIITAVSAKAHEISPMSGPAVVLETDNDFQIEAYVSEIDVERVLPGAQVKLTFDGLPEVVAQGVIATIDPAATIVLGVVNYKVTVALTAPIIGIKPALTADLEILTDSRENVLFVPRKAVSKTADGYTVKVLESNAKISVTQEVQVGLIGDSETEILSGLAEGDQVVLKEL